jgi:hypothetical protein
MSRKSFVRVVTKYRNFGDERLVAEYALPPVQKRTLHRLFDTRDDIDVVGAYEISSAQRTYFEELLGRRLDMPKYAYFIEVYALPQAPKANGTVSRGRAATLG